MKTICYRVAWSGFFAAIAVSNVVGCGSTDDQVVASTEDPTGEVDSPHDSLTTNNNPPAIKPNVPRQPNRPPRRNNVTLQNERTFEDLLNDEGANDPYAFGGAHFGHPSHDDAKLVAAGIRKVSGRRLTVYTDLPQGDVDGYPKVFELAIPQWQAYFKLPAEKVNKWRMTVYVIQDKELFRKQGLLPDSLPLFQHGYQRGYEMWVYEQASDYYRRHLLLHEGTHAVTNTLLGGSGPPWYMEGIAELLATHRYEQGQLTLAYNPPNSDSVPYWGRVKIIRDDFAANRGLQLKVLMNYDERAHQRVEAYAWCWAACRFLNDHPASQAAFHDLRNHTKLPGTDFNRRFQERLADVWPQLAEDWYLLISQMEYGSDVARLATSHRPSEPLDAAGATVTVDVSRGWQSSGVEVTAGQAYRLQSVGQFTIAREPDGTPWPCEPGGVTLRYYAGRPLGELQVAVRDGNPRPDQASPLSKPASVGKGRQLTPARNGTLYFKVNDSPAELKENQGELKVHISR